jgi:PPOX class probable F420-dependent enzyme
MSINRSSRRRLWEGACLGPSPISIARFELGLILASLKTKPLDELPDWARELLADACVARLGLLDDEGAPRVLPVTFALAGDTVCSAVDHKPKRSPELARLRWLRRDPRAALTVDRYSDDWDELAWVQVLGAVRMAERDDEALAALTAKYPQYRERPPGGPFLRLEPARALCWSAVQ